MEGVKENAEGAEGVSEGGLDAKEKPEDAEPKAVDAPREKAGADALVVGTEKLNDDDEEDTCPPAGGTMLNGAMEEEAVGAAGVAAATDVRPKFEKDVGAGVMEAELLDGCVAKEPVNREKKQAVRHVMSARKKKKDNLKARNYD